MILHIDIKRERGPLWANCHVCTVFIVKRKLFHSCTVCSCSFLLHIPDIREPLAKKVKKYEITKPTEKRSSVIDGQGRGKESTVARKKRNLFLSVFSSYQSPCTAMLVLRHTVSL